MFLDFSSPLLDNRTFFFGILLFLAFLTPELFLFLAWNLFFSFTCVRSGAMFLCNILEQHRYSQWLLYHSAALTSGTLQPESLPLHLRITCPAIFDLSSWNVERFSTWFPPFEGGVWSKFFDQVSADQVVGICFMWRFFRGTTLLRQAEEASWQCDTRVELISFAGSHRKNVQFYTGNLLKGQFISLCCKKIKGQYFVNLVCNLRNIIFKNQT